MPCPEVVSPVSATSAYRPAAHVSGDERVWVSGGGVYSSSPPPGQILNNGRRKPEHSAAYDRQRDNLSHSPSFRAYYELR